MKNPKLHFNTVFGLLAEYGTDEILLEDIALKYFGLDSAKAKQKAALNLLPIPAYRAGSQKSPWLVSAATLADYLDTQKRQAAEDWKNMNS